MSVINLVPAYGRDYKSKAEVQKDLDAGKDFTIADISHRFDGKPGNKENFIQERYTEARIRYSKLRKVSIFKLTL